MVSNVDDAASYYSVGSLNKATNSVDEVRALLLSWRPEETPLEFADRVIAEGVLSKATHSRLRDLVLVVFKHWFLMPDHRAAERLKELVGLTNDRQVLNELIFLYKARANTLLYDFVILGYWPQFEEGAIYLQANDVEVFINQLQEEKKTSKPWSSKTIERVRQGVMVALLTAGLTREEKRDKYGFSRFRPGDFTLAYLAYDLHLSGCSDSAIADHADYRLFGLDRSRTVDRLSALPEKYGMIVQQAGSVVRISWLFTSISEVMHAVFGQSKQ